MQPQLLRPHLTFQLTLQFFTALPSGTASFPGGDLIQVLPCRILEVLQVLVCLIWKCLAVTENKMHTFQLSAMPDAVEGLCIPVSSLGQLSQMLLAAMLEQICVISGPLQVTVAHPTMI